MVRSRFLTLAAVLVPAIAHAQQPVPDASSVPEDIDRLILDTGRFKSKKPEPDALTIDVHGELLSGQVADVPHRGEDVETVTQEPLQSLRLGRRFDDDQAFAHSTSLFPIGLL